MGRRYGILFALHSRVARHYHPAPAAFPTVVIEQHDGPCAAAWSPLVERLQAHHVGGDHNSMLQPPHVAAVAAVVGELLAGGVEPSAGTDEAGLGAVTR